jgi:tetratricopeptide (TPR) repeat protein
VAFSSRDKIVATRLLFIVFLVLPCGWTSVANAQPVKDLITEAMQECHLGRIAQERAVRLAHFEKGQRIGEQAVAIDDESASAHFALFCNLGELMRIDGELNLTSVMGFRRMMKELDRTLELAPEHLDALSAKGTFLVRLPSILGGDSDRGEQLLQQVIKRAPRAVNARLSLAKSYCSRGHHHDAMILASEALSLAQAQQRADLIPEATRVVAQVRATGINAN